MANAALVRQRGVTTKKVAWVRDGAMIMMTAIDSENSEYTNGLAGDCRVFDEEFSELCAAADKEFGVVGSSKATPISDADVLPRSSLASTSVSSVPPTKGDNLRAQPRSCLRERDPNVSNSSVPSRAQSVSGQRIEGLKELGEKRVADIATEGVPLLSVGQGDGNEGTEGDKENRIEGRPPLSKRSKRGGVAAVSKAKSNANLETKSARSSSASNSGSLPPHTATCGSVDNSTGGGDSSNALSANKLAELRAMPLLSMRVVDLRAALKKFGLPSTGVKAVLQGRLQEAVDTRIAILERMLANDPGTEENEEEPRLPAHEIEINSVASSPVEQPVISLVVPVEETEVVSQTRLSVARVLVDVQSPVGSSPGHAEDSSEAQEARTRGHHARLEEQSSQTLLGPVSDIEIATAGEVRNYEECENNPIMKVASDGSYGEEERGKTVREPQLKSSSEIDETDAASAVAESASGHGEDSAVAGEQQSGGHSCQQPLPSASVLETRSLVPDGENIVQVIPESTLDECDDSSVPVEEEENKEDEMRIKNEAGESEANISCSPSHEANGQTEVAASMESEVDFMALKDGNGCVEAAEAVPRVEGDAVHAAAGDAMEGSGSAQDDIKDVKESRNKTVEDTPSSASRIATTKSAKAGSDGSSHQLHPCSKTPSSGGTLESSTSLPTSGGSFTKGTIRSRTTESGESVGDYRIGGKRPLPTLQRSGASGSSSVSFTNADVTEILTDGNSGGGEGGSNGSISSKKLKLGKDKVSLQEHMSRLRKDYAEKKSKVVTPGGASKSANGLAHTSAKTPAVVSECSSGGPSPPSPMNDFAPKTTATVAALVEAPSISSLGVKTGELSALREEPTGEERGTADASKTAVVAVKKPSNLVSTMHSFLPTLVKADNRQGATAKKWDRLAAGAGASASAPSVPALRKAEEARLHEEKRARERAAARLRLQLASQSTVPSLAATVAAAGRTDHRNGVSGVAARVAGARVTTLKTATQTQAASFLNEGGSLDGSVGDGSSVLAPLRVTGMLSKLVPDAPNRDGPVSQALSDKTKPGLAASDLPGPFRPSVGNASTLGARWKLVESAADGDVASFASSRTSASSSVSAMSIGWGGGAGAASVASSSEKIERRIRDQRAQIEAKRNARKEKMLAEEEKKKVELESKRFREAARLEAARRVKHEAEVRAREQNTLRHAEAERRREQERVEKEAKESKEREEKEAKRRARLEAKEAAEREHKVMALAASKKTKGMNIPPSEAASTLGGPATAMLKPPNVVVSGSNPSASMSTNVLSTAPVPTTAVLKPSSGNVATTQASITSSSGGSEPLVAKDGGKEVAAAAGVVNSYEMSDHDGSSSESDSDEEEEQERKRRNGKKIPSWAKGSALSDALRRQYSLDNQLDPDTIFPEVFSCDLEAIFPVNKSRYHRRGSSANWAPDRVTPQEVLTYKRSVGILKHFKP